MNIFVSRILSVLFLHKHSLFKNTPHRGLERQTPGDPLICKRAEMQEYGNSEQHSFWSTSHRKCPFHLLTLLFYAFQFWVCRNIFHKLLYICFLQLWVWMLHDKRHQQLLCKQQNIHIIPADTNLKQQNVMLFSSRNNCVCETNVRG